MKIRVEYTVNISADSLAALNAYNGEKLGRADIVQILTDLGKMGVEEQIFIGSVRMDPMAGQQ